MRLVLNTLMPPTPSARCAPPCCLRSDVSSPLPLPEQLRVGTVESADLGPCTDVLVECFYKDALTLAAEEFTEEEMEQLRPALSAVNGYLAFISRVILSETTRQRVGKRLKAGGTGLEPRGSALMLAAQDVSSRKIVAIAELSTQPRDGKVPGDLRLPRLPGQPARDLETAYVSNLCVTASWRKRGVARAMLRICEDAARAWGYDEVYLHAATRDTPLISMYEALQYEQLPDFDQPGWVLALSGREQTRYMRCSLDAKYADAEPVGAGEGVSQP